MPTQKTKSASAVAEKWSRVTPGRTEDYTQGIKNPRTDWASATAAAEANYKLAVTTAANAGRFGKGVSKVGSAKWLAGAVDKGIQRFGSGVQAGAVNFATAIQPVLDTINAVNYPPKYPKGDPRNIDRVTAVTTALHKKKVG